MAARKSLVHPVLFSTHFGIPAKALGTARLLDPILAIIYVTYHRIESMGNGDRPALRCN